MPEREPGLYRNGSRWWMRVGPPGSDPRRVSSGTTDLRHANRMAQMVKEFRHNRQMWEWLSMVHSGDVRLADLYDHWRNGSLDILREDARRAAAEREDADVEPFVSRWLEEVVQTRGLTGHTALTYERYLRALVPAGERFPRSRLNEDYLTATLAGLRRSDGKLVSGSSRRAYFNAWRQFFRWARKRVPLIENPFEDMAPPRRSPSRTVYWEFDRVQEVLSQVPRGHLRVALTLIFGSGIELGAITKLLGQHVLGGNENKIMVPGTKNDFRRNRVVFVDAWAWPAVNFHARNRRTSQPLFDPDVIGYNGRLLREALYEAQVRARLIPAPPRSSAGKPLWGSVPKHDVHDARHTYAMIRLLGLDGARPESMKYVANQLGHVDEQMVMRIYSKFRAEDRLRFLELSRASTDQPTGTLTTMNIVR